MTNTLHNGCAEIRRYEFDSPNHCNGDYIGIVLCRRAGSRVDEGYITWEYWRYVDDRNGLTLHSGHYDMGFIEAMNDWLDRGQAYLRRGHKLHQVTPMPLKDPQQETAEAQAALERVNQNWQEQPKPARKYTQHELVKVVKDHALKHYDTPGMGWDFLIECYSDKDIAELIEGARTPAGAIKKAKVMASAHGEQRAATREDQ